MGSSRHFYGWLEIKFGQMVYFCHFQNSAELCTLCDLYMHMMHIWFCCAQYNTVVKSGQIQFPKMKLYMLACVLYALVNLFVSFFMLHEWWQHPTIETVISFHLLHILHNLMHLHIAPSSILYVQLSSSSPDLHHICTSTYTYIYGIRQKNTYTAGCSVYLT